MAPAITSWRAHCIVCCLRFIKTALLYKSNFEETHSFDLCVFCVEMCRAAVTTLHKK